MKYKNAFTLFPKKLHTVVDHGTSVCLQVDDVTVKLSKVTESGEFIKQKDHDVNIPLSGTHVGRVAVRIPKKMLVHIKELFDGIEDTDSK